MKLHARKGHASGNAFSLMEVLVALAVLGIIATITSISVSRTMESSKLTKLESDVTTVNSAIKMYLSNGGSLTGVSSPQAILNKLKTSLSAEDAARFAGLRSSMIDKRLEAIMQTADESSSNAPRAIWNSASNRFVIANSGSGGVAQFTINDSLASTDFGTEEREVTTHQVNPDDGWIWSYTEDATQAGPTPTSIPLPGGTSGGGTTGEGSGDSSGGGDGGGGDPLQLYAPDIQASSLTLDLATNETVTIELLDSNPGDALYRLEYLLPNEDWQTYTSVISVSPESYGTGFSVSARATPTSPEYIASDTNSQVFAVKLLPPTVTVPEFLDLSSATPATVTISDSNASGSHYTLQYQLPNGSWQTYTAAISVLPADYSDGFTVRARATATEEGFLDSDLSDATSDIKLLPPNISLSDPKLHQRRHVHHRQHQ